MGTSPTPTGEPIESVFDRAAPRLRRYFRNKGFGDEAEDMVQECFRRTVGRRADRPEAFLMRTAVNLAIEHWRARSRHRVDRHVSTDSVDLCGLDPLMQLEAADLLRRVEASLVRLTPRTRTIFFLHRVDGLTLPELAARYGLSIHGVEYHLAKAMKHIRRFRDDLS
ncbi:RNA polymerase sigma factor [Rhizorhapis suberifaciens]|uniref:RNA polymerase sigma-70 factor (ECF subfamily) n=1 Tax=Rhizorhapis suberifaciens TaxID=13656 RepID=A0A840HXJ4_9SPHN|nr:sigma-70 family RNA polymerase sigma factor [Rhizorhapis suberifaciens]MBB4642713.1 RNA polymerase sigma-70 factor (ECF subfamily) [Rhizorhapis suberifaciens]